MQEKRRALGKGLEQLFSNEAININDFEKSIVESAAKEDIKNISLDDLRSNPYQPRQHFDEVKLEELAASIKEYGVIEPIIVKKSIKGYEIVAGERRTMASKKAGLKTIPSIIKEFSDDEMLEIAVLENIQRENLNVIEEALAYKKMIDTLKLTQEELSKKIGKSRSHLTNILGLLKLPTKIQNLVSDNKISMGHAKILSKINDTEEIFNLTQKIIDNNLSVRDLEDLINKSFNGERPVRKTINNNSNYSFIQDVMREKIGTMVKVNNRNIVIPFDSEKDLERVLEILNIKVDSNEL